MSGAVTASEDSVRVTEQLKQLPADDPRSPLVHQAQLAALTALILHNKERSS